jgi:hypothetical protein
MLCHAVIRVQEGSMRCDVNVSVRPKGRVELGTKVEVKNMNSFRFMQTAIDFEISRQVQLIQDGRTSDIVQETRLFDEAMQVLFMHLPLFPLSPFPLSPAFRQSYGLDVQPLELSLMLCTTFQISTCNINHM